MESMNLEMIKGLIELTGDAWQKIEDKRLDTTNELEISYGELDELAATLDAIHSTLERVRRGMQTQAR